jgi:hypothetical protein
MPLFWVFVYDNVDSRIAVRELIAQLRARPGIASVTLSPVGLNLRVEVQRQIGYNTEPLDTLLGSDVINAIERLQYREPAPPRPLPDPGTTIRSVMEAILQLGSVQIQRSLASSMIQPLRRNIDYSGVGRHTFLVDTLPNGAENMFGPPIPNMQLPSWVQGGAHVRQINGGLTGVIEGILHSPTNPLITVTYDDPLAADSSAIQLNHERFFAEWVLFEVTPEPLTDYFDRLLDEDLF